MSQSADTTMYGNALSSPVPFEHGTEP